MKKNKKIILMITSVIAIILEILPFGAVCNFVDERNTIRKTFSYFSLTPYGYSNFAPFITAILTCAIFVLSIIYIAKDRRNIGTAITVVSLITALISLAPLLYGFDYFSVVGGLISATILVIFIVSLYVRKQ